MRRATRERLIEQLKRHEGFRGQPYDDRTGRRLRKATMPIEGRVTIGYGRNLDANPLSETEAEFLLGHDVDFMIGAMEGAWDWLPLLGEVRRAALVNMAFNLGLGGLRKFKRMLAELEAGAAHLNADSATHHWQRAAAEARKSRWFEQVGARGIEIADQIESGRWTAAAPAAGLKPAATSARAAAAKTPSLRTRAPAATAGKPKAKRGVTVTTKAKASRDAAGKKLGLKRVKW